MHATGSDADGSRHTKKLQFLEALRGKVLSLQSAGRAVCLAGDLNIALRAADGPWTQAFLPRLVLRMGGAAEAEGRSRQGSAGQEPSGQEPSGQGSSQGAEGGALAAEAEGPSTQSSRAAQASREAGVQGQGSSGQGSSSQAAEVEEGGASQGVGGSSSQGAEGGACQGAERSTRLEEAAEKAAEPLEVFGAAVGQGLATFAQALDRLCGDRERVRGYELLTALEETLAAAPQHDHEQGLLAPPTHADLASCNAPESGVPLSAPGGVVAPSSPAAAALPRLRAPAG